MGLQSTQGYKGKLVDKLTGEIIDTFADEDIKVSNNILELFDLGDIPGTYTQQITLPGTKKNNAFFEHYYDISVWEPDIFNTNQVVEAYLDFDGFYLVNGYLQLNRVNVLANKFIDSYEVTLFGIISNFSIDAKSTFLTDISSLRAYNHISSITNITASWSNGLFNGDIVYPMADYGQQIFYSQDGQFGINATGSALCVQDYKPAIRIKKVWDAIFQEFGYTYTGSFFNEPWLNDVYMFLNNDGKSPIYSPPINTFGLCKVDSTILATPSISTTSATQTGSLVFNSQEYNYNNKFTLGAASSSYTVDFATKLTCDIKLGYSVVPSVGAGAPQFSVYFVTGSTVYSAPLDALNQQLTNTISSEFRIRTDSTTFQSPTLPPGTYVIKLFVGSVGTGDFTVFLNPNEQTTTTFTVKKVNQVADFKTLDIPSNMPFGNSGILVIDFIRAIQKKFNLIIYPDKQNPNQFIVETFNNWYKQGTIKNFNRYINLENKISFTPANQLGYQQIKFTDADDNDYIETLFKRTNNRIYGESNYYDTGSFYSQGKFEVNSQAIASGPLGLVPGSVYTGSAATATTVCQTYQLYNPSYTVQALFEYQDCNDPLSTLTDSIGYGQTIVVCAFQYPAIIVSDPNEPVQVTILGDCGNAPTGSSLTGSSFPVWIPYYISDANYNPARVLPRVMFYNGTRNATPYYIQGYTTSTGSVNFIPQSVYPYFDNYSTGSLNGTASLFPEQDARSLLFNNEQAVWGTTPINNLISTYWNKYIGLLYNPRTRLVEASAVIGLADYFDLELNDIAEFRGNYYHLRAINDYNLTTGECNIQMLGPIIPDTISGILSGSWAPTVDLCAFTYTASFVPLAASWSLGYNVSDPYVACAASRSFYYTPLGDTLVSGTILYNATSSTPGVLNLNATASSGYYSDGSTYYYVGDNSAILFTASCAQISSSWDSGSWFATTGSGQVRTIKYNPLDNTVYVSGIFRAYGSGSSVNNSNNVVRINNSNGTIDTSFNTGGGPRLTSTSPGNPAYIKDFAFQVMSGSYRILIPGNYNNYSSSGSPFGGSTQYGFTAINRNGTLAASPPWNSGSGGVLTTNVLDIRGFGPLIPTGSNYIVLSGATGYDSDGVPAGFVRIDKNGFEITSIYSQMTASGFVWDGNLVRPWGMVINPDGTAVIVSNNDNGINKIDASGNKINNVTGSSWYSDFGVVSPTADDSGSRVIIRQPDGKYLVGGEFVGHTGSFAWPVNNVCRLDVTGGMDFSYNVGYNATGSQGASGSGAIVYDMILTSNDKVYIAGKFSHYSGSTAYANLVRTNISGSIDTSFTNYGFNAGSVIYDIEELPGGQLIVGGDFTSYSGSTANYIVKLNPNGTRAS